jgi:hypothetical protein
MQSHEVVVIKPRRKRRATIWSFEIDVTPGRVRSFLPRYHPGRAIACPAGDDPAGQRRRRARQSPAVGAAVTHTLALEPAGQLGKEQVALVLSTQIFLVGNPIGNMDDLRAKLPDLNPGNISSAAWIKSLTF